MSTTIIARDTGTPSAEPDAEPKLETMSERTMPVVVRLVLLVIRAHLDPVVAFG